MKEQLLRAVVKALYGKIIRYVKEHPELTGVELRLKVRKIFHTSLSGEQWQRIIDIARNLPEIG